MGEVSEHNPHPTGTRPVIRFWNKKKKRTDHIVLVTTDQKFNAPWIVRHYEERPEIEQDIKRL
jgi:hypothetical protein